MKTRGKKKKFKKKLKCRKMALKKLEINGNKKEVKGINKRKK